MQLTDFENENGNWNTIRLEIIFGGNLGLFSGAFAVSFRECILVVQVTIERFATKTFSFSVLTSLAWILGQEKRKQRYKIGFRKLRGFSRKVFPGNRKTNQQKSTQGFKSWKCVYPQNPEVSPICIQHFQRQIWGLFRPWFHLWLEFIFSPKLIKKSAKTWGMS